MAGKSAGIDADSWAQSKRLHGLSPAAADAVGNAVNEAPTALPYVLNVRPDPIDFRDYYFQVSLIEIPAAMAPVIMPGEGLCVRHQRAEGSCTGQALAAVVDIQNAKRREFGADVPSRVSARMLYSAAQAFDEYSDDGLPGSSIRGALKGFWNRGACDETMMPYLAGFKNDELTVEITKDARRVSLGAYFRLKHTLNDYHAALSEAGAILVSAVVHKDWSPETVSANHGKIPFSNTMEIEGAHAFAIVGHTPEGFLVLNSWGPKWGGYNLAKGLRSYWTAYSIEGRPKVPLSAEQADAILRQNPQIRDARMPGVALWSYEDWKNHVLDAWVMRLAAPTRLPSGFIGGYRPPASPAAEKAGKPDSVRESEVLGHIIHLRDGKLVNDGQFATPIGSIMKTASHIAASNPGKYKSILFYAHGGMNTRDAAVTRAKAMIPVFKRNFIYPVFFIWRTGAGDTISDLLTSFLSKVEERAGAFEGVRDKLFKSFIGPVAKPVWSEMKRNAKAAFTGKAEGADAFRQLAAAAADRVAGPMPIHLAAHSAGSILAGHLLTSLDAAGPQIASTTLHAPACTISFFKKQIADPGRAGKLTLVNLPESGDAAKDPALPGYSKSILWLISRAFESAADAKILGLEAHCKVAKPPLAPILSNAKVSARSRAARHGDFDNDPNTMNFLLSSITGKKINDVNGGFKLSEIGGDAGF